MNPAGLSVELQHALRLCYAMQQSAVPWLTAVTVRNGGPEPVTDLTLTLSMEPPVMPPFVVRLDTVPANGAVPLDRLDPRLDLDRIQNQLERVRGELRAVVTRGDAVLATTVSPIEVLAYNEWPGIATLPALLAAFVQPNHPALVPVLQAASARLLAATGNGGLDGYQGKDPRRALAIVAAVHDAIAAVAATYVNPPPSFERTGQKVRTADQVTGDRLATCLDLALLYAAVLEHTGLHAVLVVQKEHAFVGAWLVEGSTPEHVFGSAVELRKRCDLGALAVVECTLACAGAAQPFAVAQRAARQKLDSDAAFVCAIDVAAARRAGIRPLPPRTSAFAVTAELPGVMPGAPVVAEADTRAAEPFATEPPPKPVPAPPKDRLEHWKSKLLDLTMWNRLLNFVETKKTVRLCAHDVATLEDRLQTGSRVRVHARPALDAGGDQRDLDLASQRQGGDVMAAYLADELKAGRLRAEHAADDLEDRLVEIYRHARTSVEETGANTLYLAVGFLRWFETSQSAKPRRAPLLLLPLVIERTSVQEGFRLALDDAEPRINQTLLQLLRRDFELEVGMDAPPEDEHGVDVAAVLDAFRAAVVGLDRWEVEPVASIGFFSFTKYLMWLDLAARDELLKGPVLRHLVERPNEAYTQNVPEPERDGLDDVDPAAVLCPKDSDSSQLAAVLAAAAGRTFVLEGPPGTGKSQTITNLVAQALAADKRVLFVAEKRAALEVVQRRLLGIGLGAFCLELHSSKSGPNAVLEQLRRPLELGAVRSPAQWAERAAELQARREELNRFVLALHRRREHGFSVHTAVGRLIALGPGAMVPLPEVARAVPADVAAARVAVDALVGPAQALGVPDREVWWGVGHGDWTPELQRKVVPVAERLQRAIAQFAAAVGAVAKVFGLDAVFGDAGPSRAQVEALLELAALFLVPQPPPAALVTVADWPAVQNALAAVAATGARRDELWSPLGARWRRDLLALDLDRLAAAYRRSADAFFVVRWWRLRGPRAELQPAATGALGKPRELRADLERALQVRAEERQLAAAADAHRLLGAFWNGGLADWPRLTAWLQWVQDARRLVLRLQPGALQPAAPVLAAIATALQSLHDGAGTLSVAIGTLRAAHDEHTAALRAATDLLALDVARAFGDASVPGTFSTSAARVVGWLGDVPRLREHCAYVRVADAAAPHGLAPLVTAHAHGDVATADLPAVFERTFLTAWLDAVHQKEPQLARFRGAEHERAIAAFAALDRELLDLAAQVTAARLAARLPKAQVRDTQVASSELGILERELKKQRRHMPVRQLIARIPGLLTRLAPCVLMSPLSVAQFLGRSGARFDLVVFDEASQIPMWDAASAIGRGDSVVVVGDSRQLPPTTFFQRLEQGDDTPADDDLPDDLESVLDECSAAGLPRMHLDWHYRSRHESLIAFSNHHYYQNRLLTFPSPERAGAGAGVRSVSVAGVYDRGGSKQNKIEAEALVAEVLARLRDPARQRHSLGIVTFSQPQQVLIENLLDRERRADASLEPFFAAAEEPVFVKNLENVQGDERDVILFSICYGPDAAGKLYENYGPLNQQGGERRLNVAITRARRELVVFTSVRAEHVATRTAAIGARHLRAFLDYAERGTAALTAAVAADPQGEVESPFEAAVRDALVARGHILHPQVGCSGYRIDLGVVDPDMPGRYLLGIECDGASYHSAATARDRDRLRASVLRGLGWRLHRVWSIDWWQDPQGQLGRIEAAIAAAKADAVAVRAAPVIAAAAAPVATEPPPAAAAEPVSAPATGDAPAPVSEPEPEPPPDPDGPRPHRETSPQPCGSAEQFHAPVSDRPLRTQIAALLLAEQPLVFDRLAHLVAESWGVGRVTERVRARVRGLLPPGAAELDGALWGRPDEAAAFRGFRVPADGVEAVRAVDEIPVVELVHAMRWLLVQHQALATADLARETARCFGITRLGTNVRAVMAAAAERLVGAGLADRDGDTIRVT